jgi:hypothetical protein
VEIAYVKDYSWDTEQFELFGLGEADDTEGILSGEVSRYFRYINCLD